MTEETNIDMKSLHDIRRASIEAAMALLNKTQEDGQVRVVAEKIAIQAMGAAIAQSHFARIDRPQSHSSPIRASHNGEVTGRA